MTLEGIVSALQNKNSRRIVCIGIESHCIEFINNSTSTELYYKIL